MRVSDIMQQLLISIETRVCIRVRTRVHTRVHSSATSAHAMTRAVHACLV